MARKQHAEQHQPDFDRCCKFTWTECFEMGMHRHHPPMICISARQCPAASLYHTSQCYDQECTWVGHGFIGGGATMYRTWYTIINDVHHRTIVTSSMHGGVAPRSSSSSSDIIWHHWLSIGTLSVVYTLYTNVTRVRKQLLHYSTYCIIQDEATYYYAPTAISKKNDQIENTMQSTLKINLMPAQNVTIN